MRNPKLPEHIPSPDPSSGVDRLDTEANPEALESLAPLVERGLNTWAGIAAALPSLEPDVLGDAIWALVHYAKYDRRRVVPRLVKLLRRPEAEARAHALRGLEWTRGTRAVPAFIHHLRGDPDPNVRETAAHGLGFLFHTHLTMHPSIRC